MTTATPSREPGQALGNAVLTGALWSGVSRVAAQLLSFASIAIVAGLVGPRAYGLMNMAQIAIGLIGLIRDLGVGSAVVQRPVITDRFLSSVFWVTAALGVVATLLCYLLAPLAAMFYREPSLTVLLQVLSLSFFLTSLTTVHLAILARRMDFRTTAFIEIAGGLAGLIAAIAFALNGAGVWSLVAASLTVAATTTVALFIFTSWTPRFEFAMEDIRSISKFGINLSAFNLVNFFARNADNALIGRYLGVTPLAYYQFAYQIMLYPVQGIGQLLGRVSFPAFSQMGDDDARFRAAYLRSCNAIAFLSFPAMTGVAILAKPLVQVWLGPQWEPAATLIEILAPLGIIQCLTTTTGQIYMAKGRTDVMLRAGSWISATIVLSFVIGMHWGVIGVAIAYAIAVLIVAIPVFVIPFRFIGLRLIDLLLSLKTIALATLIMAAVVVALLQTMNRWKGHEIYTLAACSFVGAVVYFGMSLLLKVPAIGDLWRMIRLRRAAV